MRGFNSISQNRKNIFFIVLRHVGTSYARSDFLFHKKSVTRSTVPPFPKKVMLCFCCSPQNTLATLRLATNLFRVARGFEYPFKKYLESILRRPHTSERVILVPIFYCIENQSPALLFLLFRKRSRYAFAARLCARNAPACYQPFLGCKSSISPAESPKIFFS